MSNQLIMARQPIVDTHGHTIAYEFFYRNKEGTSKFSDPRKATSSVLVNILNQVGIDKSIGNARAFINICGEILLTDILYNIQKENFVFELSEDIHMGSNEINNIKKLHELGHTFALDNAKLTEEYLANITPILPYITYVKFDTSHTDIERLQEFLHLFDGITLIAQRIEFQEIYDAYVDLGFKYFQGYFIAEISTEKFNRIDPKHLGLIKIFNMFLSDIPIEEIAKEFEHHNELTLQLLQYIKSNKEIRLGSSQSIKEIILNVGKETLMQWIVLIIYSRSSEQINADKSPYSYKIQDRIDIMCELLKHLDISEIEKLRDKARLVATFSVLDEIFDIDFENSKEAFKLDYIVEEAISSRNGILGDLLSIAIAIEERNFETMQTLLSNHDLSIEHIKDSLEKIS